jgi:hypothetical protein
MCLVYARRLSILNAALDSTDGSTQNHRNMAGTTNLQKERKFSQKKYMFSILKLKKAKNLYGGYPTDFFSRERQKFLAATQLLKNLSEYTKKQN